MAQFIGVNNIPVRRVYISSEIIDYSGSTTYSLTAPANAQVAEMQFQGEDIVYAYDVVSVTDGIFVGNGQIMELESNDELNKFRFKPKNGATGKAVVFYFNTFTPNI